MSLSHTGLMLLFNGTNPMLNTQTSNFYFSSSGYIFAYEFALPFICNYVYIPLSRQITLIYVYTVSQILVNYVLLGKYL